MAKISAKKLIKQIEANKKDYRDTYGYNVYKDDKYGHGYMNAADTIINNIKDMQAKAERKKADKVVGASIARPSEQTVILSGECTASTSLTFSPQQMQYGLFLSQTSTILSSGKGKKIYSVGDVIPIMYLGKPVDFDIVEVTDHGIKLISHDILAFQPFDINGNNVYDKSSIKDYLENEFEKCFDAEFIKLLNGNKFYLPSETEIKNTYLHHDKRIKRYKGKPMMYWSSTSYDPGNHDTITVSAYGTIGLNYGYGAGGVAPAVIIGRRD